MNSEENINNFIKQRLFIFSNLIQSKIFECDVENLCNKYVLCLKDLNIENINKFQNKKDLFRQICLDCASYNINPKLTRKLYHDLIKLLNTF